MRYLYRLIFVLAMLSGWKIQAQERAINLLAGAMYNMRIDDKARNAKAKTGLMFGLLYRQKNEKGDIWSLGLEYQLMNNTRLVQFNNREEIQKERFEVLHVRGTPLTWFLDPKQRLFIDAGVFMNYLLHQENEVDSNLSNGTKTFRRTSFGPSVGIGVQLGKSLRKSFLIGIRDDFAAISMGKRPTGGKATPLKFNSISLYIGLGI